jgi:hypothetical protein
MQLHQYLAAQIVSGTRKSFGTLMADYLEKKMSANLNDDKNLNMRGQTIGSPADGKKLSNAPGQGSSVTSGMSISSPVTVGPIRPVDRKTLAGSTPGDFRSGNVDHVVLPDNPGPREPKGQAPLSGKQAAATAPESFVGAEGTDQN